MPTMLWVKNKTIALSYHYVWENVAKTVVEVRKIHTSENYVDPFTKALARNYFHRFYHEFIVNG